MIRGCYFPPGLAPRGYPRLIQCVEPACAVAFTSHSPFQIRCDACQAKHTGKLKREAARRQSANKKIQRAVARAARETKNVV